MLLALNAGNERAQLSNGDRLISMKMWTDSVWLFMSFLLPEDSLFKRVIYLDEGFTQIAVKSMHHVCATSSQDNYLL